MTTSITPSISVVICARNEEVNLQRLFFSLNKQTYPKDNIEFIFIDDNSKDSSLKLAKSFGAKIIRVDTGDIELNKGTGMHHSKKDLIYWLDADMEICDSNFFQKMVRPFVQNCDVVASFTNEFALDSRNRVESSLLRYISYDPLQRDPLFQFFSPSIESTITKKKNDYYICKFTPGKIPPAGRCMYKQKILFKTGIKYSNSFIDLETLEIVSRAGYQTFAYVPKAKIRHYHAENIKTLINKRIRNLKADYLPNIENKYYLWFDLKNTKDIVKIIFWIIWVNLLIPETIKGLVKSIFYKDLAFMWQPIVSLITTDIILLNFLFSKKGQKIIINTVKNILN